MNIRPDPYCVGCDYLGGMGTCDHIMHTRKGEKMKARTWDTARAEGKTPFEIAEVVGASEAEGMAIHWAIVSGACNQCQHLKCCEVDNMFVMPQDAPCMMRKSEILREMEATTHGKE